MFQRELGLREVKWMDNEKELSDTIISEKSDSATQLVEIPVIENTDNIVKHLHPNANIVSENSFKTCSEDRSTKCSSKYIVMPGNNVSDNKEVLQKLEFDAAIKLCANNSQQSCKPENNSSEKSEIVLNSEIIVADIISDKNGTESVESLQKQMLLTSENIRNEDIGDNNLQHTDISKCLRNNDTLVLKSFSENMENSNTVERNHSSIQSWCFETDMKSKNSFDMFDSPVTGLENSNRNCSHQDDNENLFQGKQVNTIISSDMSNNLNKTKNFNFSIDKCIMICNTEKTHVIESESVLQNSDSKKRDSLDMFDSPILNNAVNSDCSNEGHLSHNKKDSEKLNTICIPEPNNTVLCLLNSGDSLLENVDLSFLDDNNKKFENGMNSPVVESDLEDVNFGGDCLLEMSVSKAENYRNKRKRKSVEHFDTKKRVKEAKLLNEEPKINSVTTYEKTNMCSESDLTKECDEQLLVYADKQFVLNCTLKSEQKNKEFGHSVCIKTKSVYTENNTNSNLNTKSNIVIGEKCLEYGSAVVSNNSELIGINQYVKSKTSETINTSTPILRGKVNNVCRQVTNENADIFQSMFDINTQLCKIIDGDDSDKLRLNEHKANETCVLSDEDTVVATPVNSRIKTAVVKTMQGKALDSKKGNFLKRMSVKEECLEKDIGKNENKSSSNEDQKCIIKCGTTTVSCETPVKNVKASCNQITNSYLEAAFAASFNTNENIGHIDEDDGLIPSSQESTHSAVKSDWISFRYLIAHLVCGYVSILVFRKHNCHNMIKIVIVKLY